MKNVILIFLAFFSLSCHHRRPELNIYKNLYTGDYLNKLEFEIFQRKLEDKYSHSIKKTNINYHFYEIVSSSDSIIQPFKYDVKVGNIYLVNSSSAKIFDYINNVFPQKKMVSINGDSIQIAGNQSKPTLINFWFTHCSGCIKEMPTLNKLHDKYADKMNFISVTFEDKIQVKKFLRKYDFNFIQICNADKYLNDLGINTFPMNVFIDKQGFLKNVESGIPVDSVGKITDGKEFVSLIRELLYAAPGYLYIRAVSQFFVNILA
jgi:thiol-disulfide isomerase/thioredoxin